MPDAQDVGGEVRHGHRRITSSAPARERQLLLLGDSTGNGIRSSRDSRVLRRFATATHVLTWSVRCSAVCGRRIPTRRQHAGGPLGSDWRHAGSGALRYRRARHDLASPCGVRREHPVVPDERISRRRHQRGKPREQLEGRHQTMLGPTSTQLLDPICDAAAWKHPESLEREGRTRPIPA